MVNPVWSRIWKLHIPNKVKHFLWSASVNCLPTNVALSLRHVPVNTVCPICGSQSESVLHILFFCHIAQCCWLLSGLRIMNAFDLSLNEWLVQNMSLLSSEDAALFVVICWELWNNRNLRVWKNRLRQPVHIVNFAG